MYNFKRHAILKRRNVQKSVKQRTDGLMCQVWVKLQKHGFHTFHNVTWWCFSWPAFQTPSPEFVTFLRKVIVSCDVSWTCKKYWLSLYWPYESSKEALSGCSQSLLFIVKNHISGEKRLQVVDDHTKTFHCGQWLLAYWLTRCLLKSRIVGSKKVDYREFVEPADCSFNKRFKFSTEVTHVQR